MLRHTTPYGLLGMPEMRVCSKTGKHQDRELAERTKMLSFLKENGIGAVFHYIPLHSSPAGQKFGKFFGEDKYTTKESERIIRLPMYYGLKEKEIEYIVELISSYFR